MKKPVKVLANGVFKENPVLITMLGICPTLAVTSSMINGLGLGIATTFVLVCSNITISLLKNVIPNEVRLPCYIISAAGFVTFADKMIGAFLPALYENLGLFLPLIAVNCIIFARAEVFASKNNPALSALDGLGMGIGFTFALSLMGSIRELLGSGTVLGAELPIISQEPMILFILPAGGFFTFAMIIAVMRKIKKEPFVEKDCTNCPSRRICSHINRKGECAD